MTIRQEGNELIVKKKSGFEKFYNKLGYRRLGTFLFQFTLFIFALILFAYMFTNIPQEAVKYEAYKPYIDKVESCLINKSTPIVWCQKDIPFGINLSA